MVKYALTLRPSEGRSRRCELRAFVGTVGYSVPGAVVIFQTTQISENDDLSRQREAPIDDNSENHAGRGSQHPSRGVPSCVGSRAGSGPDRSQRGQSARHQDSGRPGAHARQPLPAILGIDLAGVVKVVASDVTSFRHGDEVYSRCRRSAKRIARSKATMQPARSWSTFPCKPHPRRDNEVYCALQSATTMTCDFALRLA
jgi:alcohol dehydrogenase-like protein